MHFPCILVLQVTPHIYISPLTMYRHLRQFNFPSLELPYTTSSQHWWTPLDPGNLATVLHFILQSSSGTSPATDVPVAFEATAITPPLETPAT